MHRYAASAVAIALVGIAAPGAGAAPRVSVSVVTTLAGHQLTRSAVNAVWSASGSKRTLHVSGASLPATETVVTASWLGTRHVDRSGLVMKYEREYTYDSAFAGAAATFRVEYRAPDGWVMVRLWSDDYLSSWPLGVTDVSQRVQDRTPYAAGQTVPVRFTVTLKFPVPATHIDDTITI